jgi:hypothetical protein
VFYNRGMASFDPKLTRRAEQLMHRLERLSADSRYAHQASGLRGAIIRVLDTKGQQNKFTDEGWMRELVLRGERILVEAARQIPDSD